jgi:TP901 family phage tail tape measure protein
MAFSIEYIVQAVDKFSPTINRIRRSAESTQNKLQNFSRKMTEFGGKAKETGGNLTRSLSLPLGIVGGLAFRTALKFEEAMNQVSAVSGATGKELKSLTNLAKELGETTQFSAREAANAQRFLAMAGMDTNQIIKALPGTLQLAASSNIDLASSADIATNILTGYGLEVEELSRVNDVLAKTQSSANTNIMELAEATKLVAPLASNVNMEVEETSALLGKLADSGLKGSIAGTSLRRAISSLISPTGEAGKIIDQLGLQVNDSEGNFVGLVDIVGQLEKSGASASQMMSLFGQRAGPAMSSLVKTGVGSITELQEKLAESGGTAEKMAETQMKGSVGAVKEFTSALEGLQLAFFNKKAMSTVTDIINGITKFIRRLSETSPKLMNVIGVIAVIAATLGPAIFAVGQLAIGFALLAKLGIGISILLSPVTLIVAGIIALGVALIVAYNKSDKFRKVMDKIWSVIKPIAKFIYNSFINSLIGLVRGMGLVIDGIKKLWDMMKQASIAMALAWEFVKEKTIDFVKSSVEWFKGLGKAILSHVMAPINKIKEGMSWLGNKAKGIGEKVAGGARSIGDSAASFLGFGGDDKKAINENEVVNNGNRNNRNQIDVNLRGNTEQVERVKSKGDDDVSVDVGRNMALGGV